MTKTLAAAPALPLHAAGKYVAGAYIAFLAIVLIYVAIMAKRLRTTERQLEQLKREAQQNTRPGKPERDPEMEHAL